MGLVKDALSAYNVNVRERAVQRVQIAEYFKSEIVRYFSGIVNEKKKVIIRELQWISSIDPRKKEDVVVEFQYDELRFRVKVQVEASSLEGWWKKPILYCYLLRECPRCKLQVQSKQLFFLKCLGEELRRDLYELHECSV